MNALTFVLVAIGFLAVVQLCGAVEGAHDDWKRKG
jgi:hypothetical protein